MDLDAALAVAEDARAAAEGFDDHAGGVVWSKLSGLRVCGALGDAAVKLLGGERDDEVAPVAMKARMPPAWSR